MPPRKSTSSKPGKVDSTTTTSTRRTTARTTPYVDEELFDTSRSRSSSRSRATAISTTAPRARTRSAARMTEESAARSTRTSISDTASSPPPPTTRSARGSLRPATSSVDLISRSPSRTRASTSLSRPTSRTSSRAPSGTRAPISPSSNSVLSSSPRPTSRASTRSSTGISSVNGINGASSKTSDSAIEVSRRPSRRSTEPSPIPRTTSTPFTDVERALSRTRTSFSTGNNMNTPVPTPISRVSASRAARKSVEVSSSTPEPVSTRQGRPSSIFVADKELRADLGLSQLMSPRTAEKAQTALVTDITRHEKELAANTYANPDALLAVHTAPVKIDSSFFGWFSAATFFSLMCYFITVLSTSLEAKETLTWALSLPIFAPLTFFVPKSALLASVATSLSSMELACLCAFLFTFATFSLRHWAAISNASSPASSRVVFLASRGIAAAMTLALFGHFTITAFHSPSTTTNPIIAAAANPHTGVAIFALTLGFEIQSLLVHLSYSSIAAKFYSACLISLTAFHLFYDPDFKLSTTSMRAGMTLVAHARPLWHDVLPAILAGNVLSALAAFADISILSSENKSRFSRRITSAAVNTEYLYLFFLVGNIIAVISNRLQLVIRALSYPTDGLGEAVALKMKENAHAFATVAGLTVRENLASLFVGGLTTGILSALHFIDAKSSKMY